MATYTVQSGDTLGAIAARLGVSDWRTLLVNGALAGDTDPQRLQIGAVITTPEAPISDTPTEETPSTSPLTGTQPADLPAATAPSAASSAAERALVDTSPGVVFKSGAYAEGVLGGGRLVAVRRAGLPDFYIQLYQQEGLEEFVFYEYDPTDSNEDGVPDQVKATFGNVFPPVYNMGEDKFNSQLTSGVMTRLGPASDVIGQVGTYKQFWDNMMTSALVGAGVNDPGIVGRLLRDPAYRRLITRASAVGAELTQASVLAEFRNLPIYQQIYPGINFFLRRGDPNPESSYAAYRARVTPLFRELGINPDGDGSYRSSIGTYLDAGVDDAELERFTPTLAKLQQNPGLKAKMDEWAMHTIGRALDFDEYVDVLQGTSDPELHTIIESATLAFQADQAGINISVTELRKIAANTDLTEREALAVFTEADRQILATFHSSTDRERIKKTYGIEAGDLLDAAVGLSPRSGLSRAEVQRIQQKLADERGLSNSPSGGFFLGFSALGQPQRQGLTALSAVGG